MTRDIPCTVALAFQARNGRLNAHVFMRSSDLWLGWPYDVFTFAVVTTTVCQRLNLILNQERAMIRPGALYLTAASSHLYEKNWQNADVCSRELEEIEIEPLPASLCDGCTGEAELRASLIACRDKHDGQRMQPWIIRPGIRRAS